MGIHGFFFLVLIASAAAAPWRCFRTNGGTVCFGDIGQPSLCPPIINIGRAGPPCTGPATIYTPPCSPPPCPPPCPPPSPPPCPEPEPCPCGY
ncbi:unnamed protein product [Pieris macdunnoughi]|uniref:Uncharacterized protein n=1 Tax=Pieris macdunnoughi TaxID=345717 RepID=A0A821XT08_9NEOP|nr:unnamed protein product [Pieris macdunnoughi]